MSEAGSGGPGLATALQDAAEDPAAKKACVRVSLSFLWGRVDPLRHCERPDPWVSPVFPYRAEERRFLRSSHSSGDGTGWRASDFAGWSDLVPCQRRAQIISNRAICTMTLGQASRWASEARHWSTSGAAMLAGRDWPVFESGRAIGQDLAATAIPGGMSGGCGVVWTGVMEPAESFGVGMGSACDQLNERCHRQGLAPAWQGRLDIH